MCAELVQKLSAIFTVPSDCRSFKALEEHVRQKGAEFLQAALRELLERLDKELAGQRPRGLTLKDLQPRTLDTLVGPVTYRRRRYRDRAGRYRYLLDEALSLNKRQRVSPGLAAELVMQATDQPFREAATHRKELGLPSVVSHATIHRWTRKLGQLRCQEQEQRREAVFEAGEQQPWARGRDRVVFSEADELFVKAQREKVDRIGIKASITHSGWEPRYSGSKEWRLTERHVHAGVVRDGERYWQEALVAHGHRHPVWEGVLVVNGDGASWIDAGPEVAGGRGHRQLDRFHVYRDIRRAYPDEEAAKFIAHLRAGRVDVVLDTMEAGLAREGLPAKTRARRQALWKFLSQRREQLRDYRDALRNQLPANKALNGLGAMEACVNRVLAARMKKRTMCWTIAGADAMARLRALRANGELQEWLDRQLSGPARVPTRTWHRVAKAARESCTGEWLQKNVPALAGPHASRPWVKVLRALTTPQAV